MGQASGNKGSNAAGEGGMESQGELTAPGHPPGAGLGVPAQAARGNPAGLGEQSRNLPGLEGTEDDPASSGGAEHDPSSSGGTGFGF